MVNFTLPFTTNQMILISTSQTFLFWVVVFRLRRFTAFLSLSLYDTPELAPHMNDLFWGLGDFPVSYWDRNTTCDAWNSPSGSFMFSNMKSPSHECKMTFWPSTSYSDFQTNQTFHQFHELDTELDLCQITKSFLGSFAAVVACHQERLPFRTPGSGPYLDLLVVPHHSRKRGTLQLIRPSPRLSVCHIYFNMAHLPKYKW